MTLAAWHYQAHSYDAIKPPAFGLNPLATPDAMTERPHALQPSLQDTKETIAQRSRSSKTHTSWYDRFKSRKLSDLEKQQRAQKLQVKKEADYSIRNKAEAVKSINTKRADTTIPVPSRFRDDRPSITRQATLRRIRPARTPTPSLFLQELAHLSSLLSAVAMSTLRNDIEMAESPLTEYIPGQPWPPMDPDQLSSETKREYGEDSTFWTIVYFVLGLSRSKKHRTLYNAARPFSVLGGVSDQGESILGSLVG